MVVKKGEIYKVAVEKIAYGGKGIAKINNFTVFIDHALPGDIIEAKIFKKYKNYAEAKVIKILQYSEYRVEPSCPYSGMCGGCSWQFLDYNQQLVYKRQHVLESLEHIALIKNVQVNPTIPSNSIFGYRNKMEFSCSDRKWLLPHDMGSKVESWFGLGLHVPGTFYKVLDISACLLQQSVGNDILCDVRSFIKASSQPPYNLRNHSGFWRFLVLRHSMAYNKWMINIVTSNDNKECVQPLADLLILKYPDTVVSIINSVTSKKAGIATGGYKINLAGQNTIRDRIGNYDFDISADSFFQTNTEGAKKLYDIVKLYAELSGKESVLDLYCGTGTIGMYLSDKAEKVTGIEIMADAIYNAESNCNLNGVTNCNFIEGDVKDKLTDIYDIPDVIIIDPPRAGMHKKVIKTVMDMLPDRLVYISCNPSTLSRDILELKKNYEVEVVQPIDMFPHTFHVEAVAKLRKKKK